MATTTIRIDQEDPVLFRVIGTAPVIAPELSPGMDIVLQVELLNSIHNKRFSHFALPMRWVAPYRQAIEQAQQSQAVYWVDLDYSKTPDFPPKGPEDSVPMRIMAAIQNDQLRAARGICWTDRKKRGSASGCRR